MADIDRVAPPQILRRSRSICLTKYVNKPNHFSRRTSLCTGSDSTHKNGTSSDNNLLTQQALSLKVLEEDTILNALQPAPAGSTQNEEISLETQYDFDYEQPMKVFRRAGTPDKTIKTAYEVPLLKNHVSSCQALRQAVSTLYNIYDFEMTKIGEGFFSEVFRVEHKADGKIMVLKRNKHRSNRISMLKEVQLMNNLNHPNILKYEGACVDEGQLHALTEYVSGGSLDQLILNGSQNNGEFPWLDRVSLAKDITEGLSYLHSTGIFHRDLTSKNILIRISSDRSLCAVVADFGLAAQIPKNHEDKLPQVGSPYWMSPECLQGHFYDQTSDIFSFGIILCEMIGRVEADPDFLPRTKNFGVDYLAFSELVSPDCPLDFLKVSYSCVTIDLEMRPNCDKLQCSFKQILKSLKPKRKAEMQKMTEKLNNLTIPTPALATCQLNISTPNAIGEEMSKLDPYYIPSSVQGINPFLPLFGNREIIGNCLSCFEFNAATNLQTQQQKPSYRKTVSMIGHHPSNLENFVNNS